MKYVTKIVFTPYKTAVHFLQMQFQYNLVAIFYISSAQASRFVVRNCG